MKPEIALVTAWRDDFSWGSRWFAEDRKLVVDAHPAARNSKDIVERADRVTHKPDTTLARQCRRAGISIHTFIRQILRRIQNSAWLPTCVPRFKCQRILGYPLTRTAASKISITTFPCAFRPVEARRRQQRTSQRRASPTHDFSGLGHGVASRRISP